MLQYWLNEKDKTNANGTFLTLLMMIKCHGMIADQAAAQYNVTWTRTTPIVVSVFDDAYRTIMTLECDHRFGMDVTGAAQNITAFRYACSSSINPLEHYVMETLFPGGNGTSIVMGLGKEIINGLMPSMFTSNGYLVMISTDNNLFLILDPETGILRDVMYLNGIVSGAGCFSDLQTEWAFDLGNSMLNFGQNIMNILTNGGGIIDFSQLATNTKNGLVGFLNSALISLGISDLFMGIQNDFTVMHNLYGNKESALRVFGTCLMNLCVGFQMESKGVDFKTVSYENPKVEIYIDADSAINAYTLDLGVGGLIFSCITGVAGAVALVGTEATVAYIFTGVGGAVSVQGLSLGALTGGFNKMFEDPWLKIKYNGKTIYERHYFYLLAGGLFGGTYYV